MKIKTTKMISVMIIMVMAVGLTSCGLIGGKSAGKIYNDAIKQVYEADSYSATVDASMNLEAGGQSSEAANKLDMKVINDGDNTEYEVDAVSEIPMGGASDDVTFYYKDGYMYSEALLQKLKKKTNKKDAMYRMNNLNVPLPKGSVKESSVEDKDGGKQLSMTLDSDIIMKDAPDLLGNLDQYDSMLNNVTLSDIELNAIVDSDGNLKSSTITFDMSINKQGQDRKAEMRINTVVDQVGGVTINFPLDLDSYIESSMDSETTI